MKKAVFVLIILFISVISFAQPAVGKKAKEISLPDNNGKSVNLSSLQGKIVLIDFWASWCGPCRRSVPALKKTYTKYQAKGFEIYGISLDSDKKEWLQALKEDKINWVRVYDGNGAVAGMWDINYLPNTFLLDKDGKIIAINPTDFELNELLQKLLG